MDKMWLIFSCFLCILFVNKVASITTTPVDVEGDCPSADWYPWGSSCYLFVTSTTRNMPDAEDYCNSLSTTDYDVSLASVHGSQENEMIASQMDDRNSQETWIGLYRNGTGQNGFYTYDLYSTLTGILDPGTDDPWDADGIDTFYFGGGTSGYTEYWCEYMCHMTPRCEAYTWYSYHWDYNWDYQCVGRSDRWDIREYDSYANCGERTYYDGDNGNVFKWSDGTSVNYEYWAPGSPHGSLRSTYCTIMDTDRSYSQYLTWTDESCTSRYEHFVCKTEKLVNVQTQPQYQILLRGSFYSSTGQSFDQSCSLQYTASMNEKSLQMGVAINAQIEDGLCFNITKEDVNVVSASSPMVFDGSQGYTSPTFFLELGSNLLIADVENCATDITAFAQPHSNWGEPILPTLPGCPGVNFDQSYFSHEEDKWVCVDTVAKKADLSGESIKQQSQNAQLNYGLGHTGQVRTETGEDMTVDCTNTYSTELYKSTSAMVEATNNKISEGSLCPGNEVTLLVPSAFFSFNGHEGVSVQDYIVQPSADMRFDEVYDCSDEISTHLASHTNWINPIVPQLPGCPRIIFDPDEFQEWFQQWICPSQKDTQKTSEDFKESRENKLHNSAKQTASNQQRTTWNGKRRMKYKLAQLLFPNIVHRNL